MGISMLEKRYPCSQTFPNYSEQSHRKCLKEAASSSYKIDCVECLDYIFKRPPVFHVAMIRTINEILIARTFLQNILNVT